MTTKMENLLPTNADEDDDNDEDEHDNQEAGGEYEEGKWKEVCLLVHRNIQIQPSLFILDGQECMHTVEREEEFDFKKFIMR